MSRVPMDQMLCDSCEHLHMEETHFDLVRTKLGGEGEKGD